MNLEWRIRIEMIRLGITLEAKFLPWRFRNRLQEWKARSTNRRGDLVIDDGVAYIKNCVPLKTLSQLLIEIHSYTYGYIYLAGNHPWDKDSVGVIYKNPFSEKNLLDEDHPKFALQHNLLCIMSAGQAEDVVNNAYNQKEEPTIDELVACFNYYYLHLGYLNITEDKGE